MARYGDASSPHFAVSGDRDRRPGTLHSGDAPVGSMGEIEAFHERIPPMSVGFTSRGARTVLSYEVHDVDPIQLPDIVVPAEKPAN